MSDRVRVLWLAKGLGPGGMEQLLVNHARVGDRERLDYSAAYLVERPNSVVPRLASMGVPSQSLGGRDARDPRWVARLVSLVRSRRIDVVHAHSPYVAALARPALRSLPGRPRLVYTEHNSADCYAPATRWANLATYPLDDARFAVSAAARDSVPSALGRRSEVLVHGVDVDSIADHRSHRPVARAALGVRPDELVVGIVANLRVAKNYPLAMEVARLVAQEVPNVRFVSLGQGPLEGELVALHERLGLGDAFRFLGFTPDAVRTMAGFDVLMSASDVEGLPVSVMEAKALGLPVVATRVGGLPEMVTHGVDGLLVPRRRADLLASEIVRVLRDEQLRDRLGAASARSAARYDARLAVEVQDQRYLDLVGRTR